MPFSDNIAEPTLELSFHAPTQTQTKSRGQHPRSVSKAKLENISQTQLTLVWSSTDSEQIENTPTRNTINPQPATEQAEPATQQARQTVAFNQTPAPIKRETNQSKPTTSTPRDIAGKLFSGYGYPRTTPIPDFFFDEQMQNLNESELRVLLYIFRRTFGFKREGDSDTIAYSQFLKGIKRRDGSQLDFGCGLKSPSSITSGIKGLVAKGLIFQHHQTDPINGNQKTTCYELNIDGQPHWSKNTPANTSVQSTAITVSVVGGTTVSVVTTNSINNNNKQYKQHTVASQPQTDPNSQPQVVCVNNNFESEKGLEVENQKAKGVSKGHIPNHNPNQESDRKRATDKVARDADRGMSLDQPQSIDHSANLTSAPATLPARHGEFGESDNSTNDTNLTTRLTEIGMTLPAATKAARIAAQKGYTNPEIDKLISECQTRNNPAGWLKWAFDNEYKGSLARHLPKVANDTHHDSAYRDNGTTGERQTDTVTTGEFGQSDTITNDTPLAPAIARPTPTPHEQQVWRIALSCLQNQIDKVDFDSWIRNLVLTDLNLETKTATVYAPSSYAITKISNSYPGLIEQALTDATGNRNLTLTFAIS